jgi:hypothetical protein
MQCVRLWIIRRCYYFTKHAYEKVMEDTTTSKYLSLTDVLTLKEDEGVKGIELVAMTVAENI